MILQKSKTPIYLLMKQKQSRKEGKEQGASPRLSCKGIWAKQWANDVTEIYLKKMKERR